jgi:nucleotide-binding universal stress UspA family protein
MTPSQADHPGAANERAVGEIVVPLDGSDLADRALPVAEALATRWDVPVARVTVGEKDAEEPSDGIGNRGQVTTVAAPSAAKGIVEFVEGEPGRLLVMSTHGRGRIAGALLGSVAESVLRGLDQPIVLVGPEAGAPAAELRRIVVCLDGSRHAESVLPVAETWARQLGLRLDLIEVIDPAPSPVLGDYVRRVADRLDVETRAEVLSGTDPVNVILRHAQIEPGAMLAMTTHGRSGLARLALGSVAMRTVHESPVPVLVQRALDPQDLL